MTQRRVLLVEDDPNTRQFLAALFQRDGWQVSVAENASEALIAVDALQPDLVVLDYSLPGVNGLIVCEQLKNRTRTPVLFLSATSSPEIKVRALLTGADDYLTKPCHVGELMARVRAIFRGRSSVSKESEEILELDPLQIDLRRRMVSHAGQPLSLTRIEFELLVELAQHCGKVLTYGHLIRAVWGQPQEDVRPVHVHVCNLRRKLKSILADRMSIRSVSGVGYALYRAPRAANDEPEEAAESPERSARIRADTLNVPLSLS